MRRVKDGQWDPSSTMETVEQTKIRKVISQSKICVYFEVVLWTSQVHCGDAVAVINNSMAVIPFQESKDIVVLPL